ncbi:DNA-binding response regulator [Rhodococcus sp. CUA-806]|nr:DNA-binding response regulator [Rhodococcus sp. CUA-806]
MRILVVEDEELLAATVKRGLESDGHLVVVAPDGTDGLRRATEEQYDVVVLDIMMPGLNGYEVLRRLRERKIWTPVMMLTAKDGDYDQTDAFDLGADDYMTKPFSFMVLRARLRALVRRGAPERPAILSVGSLTVDPALRRAARNGTEIRLTAKEFALLEYLARNAGSVLTKTAILRNVWDAYYEGDDNVVEVYIRYLRKKIDLPFDVASIETVRGAGYRIVPIGS